MTTSTCGTTTTTSRPALAYVSVPTHTSTDSQEAATATATRELATFASDNGYHLAGLFTDVRGRTESGLYALLGALRHGDATAVVVPDLNHLRHAGCLTGADLSAAGRFRRARLLPMTPGARHSADPTARTGEGMRP